jgi:hypothetical protein
MDNSISVGDLVKLVNREDDMPPLGVVGIVESNADIDGDHEIQFPGYPCHVGPGTYWYAHWSWLKRIDPLSEPESIVERLTVNA